MHTIHSFSGFHKVISKFDCRKYIFRGVSNKDHKLIPKIGRKVNHVYADFYTYESTLLTQFKKMAEPFLQSIPKNEWEWLAIAQHHGLPTRLLDWTKNPMVAAYFAVNKDSNQDCVIYALDSTRLDSNIDLNFEPYIYDGSIDVKVFEPNHITSRIIVQNGIFTIHNAPLNPIEDDPIIGIEKIIIKSSARKEIKKSLDMYGINKATLFPGLDGIAEYLEWFTTV